MRNRARLRKGSRTLLAVLLLICATALLIDMRTDGRAFDPVRTGVGAVVGPLQSLGARLTPPWSRGAVSVSAENAALLSENERLRAALLADADRVRLTELEGLLGLSADGIEYLPANVTAGSILDTHTLAIDVGTFDGVSVGQAVVTGGGLMGRVVATAPNHSTVRLITSPELTVGAKVPAGGGVGFLRGTADPRTVVMELIDPVDRPDPGDAVVTYGSPGGNPFPPGLPIGTVALVRDPTSPRPQVEIALHDPPSAASVAAVVLAVDRRSPRTPVVPEAQSEARPAEGDAGTAPEPGGTP